MEDSPVVDRFTEFKSVEHLCFLCLKEADQLCAKCGTPFCSLDHFEVHFDEENQYCYPFRVLQKPGVSVQLFMGQLVRCLHLVVLMFCYLLRSIY